MSMIEQEFFQHVIFAHFPTHSTFAFRNAQRVV